MDLSETEMHKKLACFMLLQEDLYYPHPLVQDVLWDSLYLATEPLLTRWPLNKLIRERALKETIKFIHCEDENSRYITIGCVEKVKLFKSMYEFMIQLILILKLPELDSHCVCSLVGLKTLMETPLKSISPELLITFGSGKME